MDEMEEKLGSILNNPQMMQQIMTLAQSLGQTAPEKSQEQPAPPVTPDIDLSMVQKLAGMGRQGGIDSNQQALLKALTPYLSRDKVGKLERAMRAAKMAKLASTFLNSGGLQLLSGR